MGIFPYYSHTTPIRILKDMGIVWETYQKGVPLMKVPENILERMPMLNEDKACDPHTYDISGNSTRWYWTIIIFDRMKMVLQIPPCK